MNNNILPTKDHSPEERNESHLSSGLQKIANNKLSNAVEHISETHAKLEELALAGKIIYHSPARMNEMLKAINTSIPEHVLNEMNKKIASVPAESIEEPCNKLLMHTEGNKAPLVMLLPTELTVNGKDYVFNAKNIDEETEDGIYKQWAALKPDIRSFNVVKGFIPAEAEIPGQPSATGLDGEGYVTQTIEEKVWGEDLIAYTSACVVDSKDKDYEDQLKLVEEVLGKDAAIGADVYLAMIMDYLITGKPFMTLENNDGSMRLHTRGADGDPLTISNFQTGTIEKGNVRNETSLSGAWSFAHPGEGIGAAYKLGKKAE